MASGGLACGHEQERFLLAKEVGNPSLISSRRVTAQAGLLRDGGSSAKELEMLRA